MQVSLTYDFRKYAASLALAVVFVSGCDRTTPENLASKADVKAGTDKLTEGATKGSEAGNANQKTNEEKSQVGSNAQNPAQNPVQNPDKAIAESQTNAEESTPTSEDKVDLSNRTFMTLKPVVSDVPADLVAHIRDVDAALRELIEAGESPVQIVGADTFNSCGMRLGQMKLSAGEKLAASPNATEEQRKLGTVAQLVALSHMSGLKDIESAKKLEQFAASLQQSSDADLAHQGRVVLLGFRLQELQNGTVSEPGQLVTELEGLFQRQSDAGFPEMMILQQATTVLTEMGFADAAAKTKQLVVSKFIESPDVQLSEMAWKTAASESRSLENFQAAAQDIYNDKVREPQMLLGAARGLYEEIPYAMTLLQFARLSTDLEYRGSVDIASALSDFIKAKAGTLKSSPFSENLAKTLQSQDLRLGTLGQSFEIDGMVDFDGKPLDWSAYKGKVVLVDFWASWCAPCIKELPNIQKTYQEFASKGFEVLSINMDEDLEQARVYLSNNRLPWKTYHSSDTNALGFQSAIAKRYGVEAIPFIAVIGTDGKVAAVHARGDRLALIVQSLLSDGLSN